MFLFIFADSGSCRTFRADGQKAVLRKRFRRSGWEFPQMLEVLDATDDLYFDRVSQIRVEGTDPSSAMRRSASRCLEDRVPRSPMAAAYVLAGELHRARGWHDEAFARYQRLFGPFVSMKQRAARRFAGAFAPTSEWSLFLRNQMFRLLSIEWLARATVGREFHRSHRAARLLTR